jgi:hypothetical protein
MARARTKAHAAEDELVNLNARVPRGLIRRVRARCALSDQTMRDFITSALEQHLTSKTRRR